MRQERTVQATIFEVFAQHDIGCELKAMSQWLDRQCELISLVAGELRHAGGAPHQSARITGGERAALCVAQAAAPAKLRGTCLPP